MARMTRSATARETALLAAQMQQNEAQPSKVSDSDAAVFKKSFKRATAAASGSRPIKRNGIVGEPAHKRLKTNGRATRINDAQELPHNLGSATLLSKLQDKSAPIKLDTRDTDTSIKKEDIDALSNTLQNTVDKATKAASGPREKEKRSKKTNTYGLTPGISPFPNWAHPTPDECEEVNRLLSTVHGEIVAPTTIPEPSLTVTGCGEVPSVLDALIRTLLSGATTGNNSAMAFNGLVQRFGILKEGIGKGSVDWDAVRRAPLKDVFEAIKRGGLADVKSKKIKAILDMVYEENQQRRDMLLKGSQDAPRDLLTKSEGGKQYEIACADQNFLSLNHLHSLATEDAMVELVKYPGIGPKTAACVLLFCLQRPCFAVDTHIFRICKWLDWVPPDKATEITAFSHLEVRIPDHLKYSLHQLLIRHGKSCPRCRAITGQSSAGWEEGCVIDHLVKRTGKRKGGSTESMEDAKPNGRKRRG
ncbi:HhH-GPD family base excision DNA repair protein [Aspergillus costaricaensis CBS 115574]|uniref:HhH-GPD family base excision DNA repair protein n=1 Tax=Aspergillus costaricaensis CBS 115574 TaxID=1448317 RepID=A0ACD1IWC7_9EURO|nr:HhH-GPD family base excision DNA repair protein [Aspergillus costaricaensis CBS 115574]RAK94635.1 HhH-GPD family base excision DNA repair protein [Aspergillus costaricaensis CBS 115574]